MWKSIVLCISLFGGAALGLALGARFVEASALPAIAAIGLCVIGVVLILAAPTSEVALESSVVEAPKLAPVTQPVDTLDVLDVAPLASVTAKTAIVSNRTPTMPFPALNT